MCIRDRVEIAAPRVHYDILGRLLFVNGDLVLRKLDAVVALELSGLRAVNGDVGVAENRALASLAGRTACASESARELGQSFPERALRRLGCLNLRSSRGVASPLREFGAATTPALRNPLGHATHASTSSSAAKHTDEGASNNSRAWALSTALSFMAVFAHLSDEAQQPFSALSRATIMRSSFTAHSVHSVDSVPVEDQANFGEVVGRRFTSA